MHRLVVPVLLSDCRGSGHVGAPHDCLQGLHKVLAEFALRGRNRSPAYSQRHLRPPANPVAGGRGGAGGEEGLPTSLASSALAS